MRKLNHDYIENAVDSFYRVGSIFHWMKDVPSAKTWYFAKDAAHPFRTAHSSRRKVFRCMTAVPYVQLSLIKQQPFLDACFLNILWSKLIVAIKEGETVTTKVCMLVQHHPFMDARIFKKEAKSLLRHGYDVSIVVPLNKEGYLYNIDGTPYVTQFLDRVFVHEGIRVVSYEDVRDTIPQIEANIQAPRCSMPIYNRLTEVGLQQDADVYHAHEFLSLYAGVCIKKELRARGKHIKLIYDSHEFTPDPYSKIDPSRKAKLHAILVEMLKEVDHVITVSEAMKTWYLTLNPRLRVEVIYNSPPLFAAYVEKQYNTPGLTVCYEGNVGDDRGSTETMIQITEAGNQLMDLKFKVIGGVRSGQTFSVPPHLQQKLAMLGWVDYELVPYYMFDVDVGWIDYRLPYTLNHMFAMPNKLFSYLNNGVPVLVNKCHEMESFVRQHHCGLVIDKQEPTPQDYVQALKYLHDNKHELKRMSVNARRIMAEQYSWEYMEQRLLDVYKRVLKPTYLQYWM